MSHTIDQIQALYFKTKEEADALSKRHATEFEPVNKKLDLLKAWMLKFLIDTGQESAKTEHGTCYKNTATSVTVEDGEKVLDFIVRPLIYRFAEVMEQGGTEEQAAAAAIAAPELGFLNLVVNKTAVMEMLKQKKELPPGVKMTSIVQLGVRRS